jgi:hypothetical protein
VTIKRKEFSYEKQKNLIGNTGNSADIRNVRLRRWWRRRWRRQYLYSPPPPPTDPATAKSYTGYTDAGDIYTLVVTGTSPRPAVNDEYILIITLATNPSNIITSSGRLEKVIQQNLWLSKGGLVTIAEPDRITSIDLDPTKAGDIITKDEGGTHKDPGPLKSQAGGTTFTAPVTYRAGNITGVLATAREVNNFSYFPGNTTPSPIKDSIDVPASVLIKSGVYISLGVPKTSYVIKDRIDDGFTVTPADARAYLINTAFTSSDGEYCLACVIDPLNYAELVYVNKDVRINGTVTTAGITTTYSCTLKQGWNYLITKIDADRKKFTYTSSPTLITGYNWTVFSKDKWENWGN